MSEHCGCQTHNQREEEACRYPAAMEAIRRLREFLIQRPTYSNVFVEGREAILKETEQWGVKP